MRVESDLRVIVTRKLLARLPAVRLMARAVMLNGSYLVSMGLQARSSVWPWVTLTNDDVKEALMTGGTAGPGPMGPAVTGTEVVSSVLPSAITVAGAAISKTTTRSVITTVEALIRRNRKLRCDGILQGV